MHLESNTLRSLNLFISSHFMFNVLAKLQSDILSNEKKEAIKTLSQYSKLIRMACKASERNMVDLNSEKQFLQTYLELERLRFVDSNFDFSIEGFDNLTTKIPPFILQPFLELAVIAGLGYKLNVIKLYFDEFTHHFKILSMVKNLDINDSLNEKILVAEERIKLLGFSYQKEINEYQMIQYIKTSNIS